MLLRSLDKHLFEVKGLDALDSATETDLLPWVKEIVVKGVPQHSVCLLVPEARPITNAYHGLLKAEANLCNFRVSAQSTCAGEQCTCANRGIQVSYTDDIVATQLVATL